MIAQLKNAYYDLFLAQKLIGVVENSQTILRQFAAISESQYKTGKGAQQDIIKAEVEVARLLARSAELEKDKATAQARINTLLYRSPNIPVAAQTDLPIPKLAFTVDELYKKAESNYPQLRIRQREIEKSEINVSLAKKGFFIPISRDNLHIITGEICRRCMDSCSRLKSRFIFGANNARNWNQRHPAHRAAQIL